MTQNLPKQTTHFSTIINHDDTRNITSSHERRPDLSDVKLYDILRDMDFPLTSKQVEVFENIQDAEVNGGFF